MLSELIEALQIFLKYGDPAYPTHCEHDVMHVCIEASKVSQEDEEKLNELGFHADTDGYFSSYKYGSA